MAGPGNILIRIGAEAGDAVREFQKVNGQMDETTSRSQKVGAALKAAAVPATIALGAIAVGAKKAIDSASNLNEEVNKSQVIFGKSGATMQAWAMGLAESFGLSATAALEAAGQFGNMLVPMGFTRKEAAGMSKSMVQLAGDMASFNNASPADTLEALRAGLAGESEPLRKYGVFLSDARLKQEALNQGLYSGKGVLDAHAKAAATMAIIMRDTADAQGDFARTSSSAANQARIQAAETENLSAELGQSLLPYYEAAQRLLLDVTKAMAGHTTAVKVAVGVIAGLSAAILVANAAIKAYNVIMVVSKAATIAWRTAQLALNLAFAANPIGLVIVAVAALAAALVIAYKRSETFRSIVQAALGAVRSSVEWLSRAFSTLLSAASSAFSWVVNHWRVGLFALGPIGAALYVIIGHFNAIRNAAAGAFSAITGAIQQAIELVKQLIAWLSKIKVPSIKLPHVPNPFMSPLLYFEPVGGDPRARAGGAPRAMTAGYGGVTVNFYGPTDPEGAARAIARVLRSHEARQGRTPRFAA